MTSIPTVLVVDPDEGRRRLLSDVITNAGVTAVSAGPNELVEQAAFSRAISVDSGDKPVDAVLCGDVDTSLIADIHDRVEGSDTVDTVPTLLSHPSDGSGSLASEVLAAGATDYIDGDVPTEELVARVQSAVFEETNTESERNGGDSTDFRAIDAVLEQVFETSPVGLFAYDKDMSVVRLNKRAEELLRADRERFNERMNDEADMRELIDEDGNELARADLPSGIVARTGEPVFGQVVGAREGDGIQWMIVNAAPVHHEGELVGIVVAVDDITEQRRKARELQRQNRRLERFGAIVSHDLRSPLSVASGYLDIARDAETDDEREHALERVADAHDRIEDLVTGLRTLSRKGDVVGEAAPVTVESVARDAWNTASTGDLTLRIESADTVVSADRERLRQLFENLFRNTADHGGSATTVTVRADGSITEGSDGRDSDAGTSTTASGDAAEPDDESYRTCRITVTDDGDGFGSLSNPFGTADADGEGTGLGLTIVSEIATAHGWTVNVVDAPTGGARIVIDGVELD